MVPPDAPPYSEEGRPATSWRSRIRQALADQPQERRRTLRAFQPVAPSGPEPGAGTGTPYLASSAGGPQLLDLASNDYLGLSRHPAVVAAACAEIASQGLGAGASRLVSGSRPIHQKLEAELAGWLGRERVLLFPSGFQANIAAVVALADRHTLVVADRLIHHSLLTGVRCSGARLRRFAHNDLADLERQLRTARRASPKRRLLVLSESLYSMEGSSPDVGALAGICARQGALLLLDEAHGLGVLGPGGRGLAHGLAGVDMVSGTFGKALGSGGAFLATDALLGEWLLQSSGAFRYTTALAPALAAGALAAMEWIRSHPQAPAELLSRAARWRGGLSAAGWPRPPGEGPILSVLVGGETESMTLQRRMEQAGLLGVAIRPPTVPEGTSRLRLVLRQDLPLGTLDRLLSALGPGPHAGPDAGGSSYPQAPPLIDATS